ncbi:putative bifunctional diguanylate cyclase/phosphodiesterase [Sphingomonas floccifaciens]|uniref:Bifunctional diguanylate cyclase/phosphodiesterase n=1 Tax=Sphingomonas floccifaciens TaxID=1844115 RepID=A0ABW4NER5_9SPHN
MVGLLLKNRAALQAAGTGLAAFVLTLLLAGYDERALAGFRQALIAGGVCALLCWLCVRWSVAAMGGALDAAIHRLEEAAHGDLESPIPPVVRARTPTLARAMRRLFRQLHGQFVSIQRLAMFDPVTGLANRTSFRRSVERQLADMPENMVAAMVFIDLDRFKAVNDTLGHGVGDQLLTMVGSRLRAIGDRFTPGGERSAPTIGRLSGDEFTLFFPTLMQSTDAGPIAEAILATLSAPFDLAGRDVRIGASIGIAIHPDHGTMLSDLMRSADTAMYHAKNAGRGRAEYFSDTLADQIAERAQLEADLRDALDRDQFSLVFQPQVAIGTRRVVAAEALLRWRHPSGEDWLPGAFLPRAEESGLIVDIGDWVIASVAETIHRWSAIGVDHRLAVNISRRELDHAEFFRRLHAAMQAADAPAHLLELEITETLAMHCSDAVVAAIAALRADGATIAIDDFGTGYSNILRLRALPIDRVKIDRSLIEAVATDREARSIVQSLVGLIHGLGLEAVAEGVESATQADVLRVIGCDVIQGYAVARPMTEDAFLDWSDAGRERLRA